MDTSTPARVFDREDYLSSLPHIGTPVTLPDVPFALLRRPIFATGRFDLMGGWPYSSAPDAEALEPMHAALVASGAVAFVSILPPDSAHLPEVGRHGFALIPLKQHYVIDPALPPRPLSKKARGNLRDAGRVWQVERNAPISELAPLATRLYDELLARRQISALARMPHGHFNALLRVAGIETLAIRAADGELGGLVVAACDRGQTHMIHILASARAMRSNGTYLLMQAAADIWGRNGPVYMGGVPSSPGSSGVAQFKERWANRLAPVTMLTAILDTVGYARLAQSRGAPGFFPAYRHPDGVEHVRTSEGALADA